MQLSLISSSRGSGPSCAAWRTSSQRDVVHPGRVEVIARCVGALRVRRGDPRVLEQLRGGPAVARMGRDAHAQGDEVVLDAEQSDRIREALDDLLRDPRGRAGSGGRPHGSSRSSRTSDGSRPTRESPDARWIGKRCIGALSPHESPPGALRVIGGEPEDLEQVRCLSKGRLAEGSRDGDPEAVAAHDAASAGRSACDRSSPEETPP